jgi:sterol desaturase/sphingolipid hydroxylase (fatty acid hydroxylase superfamily)
VAFFIVAGGFMASLNHTRYDISLPCGLYDVKYHDEHHVVPSCNYGQYTMLWDHLFGSYREHPLIARGEVGGDKRLQTKIMDDK